MTKRDKRCQWFYPDGSPRGDGCRHGARCFYQHPQDPGWITAKPTKAPSWVVDRERMERDAPRASARSPPFSSRRLSPMRPSNRTSRSPPPRRRRSPDTRRDRDYEMPRRRERSYSRDRSASPRRDRRYDERRSRERRSRSRSGSRSRKSDKARTRVGSRGRERSRDRERSTERRRKDSSLSMVHGTRERERSPKREPDPEPQLKRTPKAPAAMRRHSQSTKSPTPNSRRSSFATPGVQSPAYPPASHSGTSSFIHTPSTSFTKIAPHTFTTLSAPAPPAVPPSVYPRTAPSSIVRTPSASSSAPAPPSAPPPPPPPLAPPAAIGPLLYHNAPPPSVPRLRLPNLNHIIALRPNPTPLESIPPPPQPPALLSALASTSSSGGLDVNAWDDKIQRISDYLRASAAFDKLNSDTTTARKYPTTATSDPRIVAREKRKIELSEERKNALAAVVAQPTWPVDPREGPSEALENQRAQTLDKLTTFAKAVNDLYDAMVTVHARHKKQQEEELAAKAEEEASRKRPREEEEAAPDPEDELAEKVAALELDMRALADDFEEQYDAIDEQVATEVRNILTAIEGAKPIDVDAPAAPALAPEDRLKQHIQQAGTLGTDIQDILQTFVLEEGAHSTVLQQRKEIAALREEVDAFNKEAPDIQQEIDDLAKQQTALERHLAALTIGLDAHVDRHPPTPPQSPILAPTPMLELPAKDGAPSLEHAIKEEVRARLRPILQAARQEIGEAYIAQGGEVVRTVVPHLTKVNRVLETLAKRESVAVRREPNVGFTLGPWGHPPA